MSNEPNQQLAKAPVSTELKAPPTPEEAAFELFQRQAKMLAASTLVPKDFQNNTANCGIAIEIARRLGVSAFMIAQNIDVIHGRPGFRATFMIAMVNASRRFTALKYRMTGEGATRACVAYCQELATGEQLEGPEVSMAMAKAEGWSTKNGSKWLTMPELMLRYRAAAFFARLYAPDVLLGMNTADELEDIDIPERNVTPAAKVPEVKGLFAPVETPAAAYKPLTLLAAKLEAADIGFAEATDYLRSQAVTEAATFDDITPEEAHDALVGFSHLAEALAPVAP